MTQKVQSLTNCSKKEKNNLFGLGQVTHIKGIQTKTHYPSLNQDNSNTKLSAEYPEALAKILMPALQENSSTLQSNNRTKFQYKETNNYTAPTLYKTTVPKFIAAGSIKMT